VSDQIPPLTPAEIAHFLQEGFLVKRGVLHPEQCAVARNRLWASNRSKKLRRDDAATWIGGFPPDDRQVDISGLNDRGSQFLWRLRELAGDLELIQLLPLRVWPWLVQLVGEDELVEPRATSIPGDRDPGGIRLRGHNMYGGLELRGLYCVLPQQQTDGSPSLVAAARAGAHLDFPPKHLVVSGLVDDVPPGGGGLALFPRSHKLLFERNAASVDIPATVDFFAPHPESGAGGSYLRPKYKEDYQACQQQIRYNMEPFEFYGAAGDVALWHARIFHSATPNYSQQIRQMVLYDVVKKSVHESFYHHYRRGPRPSMPPNIRQLYGLELGSPAPHQESEEKQENGFWAEWSQQVRDIAEAEEG